MDHRVTLAELKEVFAAGVPSSPPAFAPETPETQADRQQIIAGVSLLMARLGIPSVRTASDLLAPGSLSELLKLRRAMERAPAETKAALIQKLTGVFVAQLAMILNGAERAQLWANLSPQTPPPISITVAPQIVTYPSKTVETLERDEHSLELTRITRENSWPAAS